MSEGTHTYDHPRPMVTVDAVVFAGPPERRRVLLVQRKHPPFSGEWALPGGFVDMEETLEAAAARELLEETGLDGVALRQFHTFGDPGRDPRGRTISVAYVAELKAEVEAAGADDAADARWFALDALPALAFDHARILAYALKELTWKSPRMMP